MFHVIRKMLNIVAVANQFSKKKNIVAVGIIFMHGKINRKVVDII